MSLRIFKNLIFQIATIADQAKRKVCRRKVSETLSAPISSSISILGSFSHGTSCLLQDRCRIAVLPQGSLHFGNQVYIGFDAELGASGKIEIGDHTSLQDRCIILGDVSIGAFCTFAPNVYVSSGTHNFQLRPELLIKDQDLLSSSSMPVSIHEDCWIGINVFIARGITIGKGALVGANSVVTKDVPPYAIVVGNPAKVLKYRLQFSPPRSIEAMNERDFPYFYSGFQMRAEDRVESSKKGGLFLGSRFQIFLATENSPTLELHLKSEIETTIQIAEGPKVEVRRGDQKVSLQIPSSLQMPLTLSFGENFETRRVVLISANVQ